MIVDSEGVAFAFLGHLVCLLRHTDYRLIEIPWLSKIHGDPVTECYNCMDISISAIAQNDKNAPLQPNDGPNMVQYCWLLLLTL
jgi:hypothetical protein